MDAIFTFHSIDDGGSVLSYRASELRAALEGLLEDGVRVVPLAELLHADPAGGPRAALTFDDGLRSVHRWALPLLLELGLPALVYVVTDRVGRDNRWPGQDPAVPRFELMSWAELGELARAGVSIGSHTQSHARLDRLADEELDAELLLSRRRIEDELGVPAAHFAFPCGVHDPRSVERAARVYDTAVTTEMRFLQRAREPHRLPRIESYYLRSAAQHRPWFGRRTRAYLAARAFLRRLRPGRPG
jgi:peptidoglycan/xylan/chitin deacetylase (PgdA/CDA1 family)